MSGFLIFTIFLMFCNVYQKYRDSEEVKRDYLEKENKPVHTNTPDPTMHVEHAFTHLGFLCLSARPSLTRKSAMLINSPILLEQNKVTGTGRSSVNSLKMRK